LHPVFFLDCLNLEYGTDAVPKRLYPITNLRHLTTKNNDDPNYAVAEPWNLPNLVHFNKFPIKVTSTKFHENPFYQFSCYFTRSDEETLLDKPLGCEQANKEKETKAVLADRAAAA